MTIPVLTREDVEPLLDWGALADALAEGHRGNRAEVGDQFLHRGEDTLLSRAAWIDGLGLAVKSATVFPGNASSDISTINGGELSQGQIAWQSEGVPTRWRNIRIKEK